MLTHEVARAPAVSRLAGCVALIGAALSVAVHVWIGRGVFVPVRLPASVEYVWISATAGSFAAILVATSALLLVVHLLVRQVAASRGIERPLLSWADISYVLPLWCFAATALSLLNLVRPRIAALSVLSYVIVDLRWWWTLLVLLWIARNLDIRLRGGWRTRLAAIDLSSGVRRWLPEAAIALIAIAWTVLGTPILRSDGATAGDEPKYVRYCETLYQGRGFEISQIKALSELPPNYRPQLWRNVVQLARILPGELRGLASDARTYVRDPSHQFNVAVHHDGGFLDGKAGGMYQVHNPGVSLLMLPAYLVDRTFVPIQPGSPAQWPSSLPAVHTFFLLIYAGWTILLFRFLQRCGATRLTAWVASLTFTLTMPASAFPFQYYPELAAGLFISMVAVHILFGEEGNSRRSFVFGLLTGYLLWLHVRFSIEVLALAVGAFVLWRGQWSRLIAFGVGIAIPIACFVLYAYRITGSAIPSALWMAEGSEANFNFVGMIKNSAGYLLDREWGLFAHSPVFLLAIPGYWWMAREKPRVAFMCALVFVALLLPSAGKTLVQTTPMRLIVAAIPLGATPMVMVLERRSRAVLIVFALLAIVSLDNALSYNLHHYRHGDTLVDWSFSGWKVNLLFPQESRRPWTISAANGALLVAWLAMLIALAVAPAVMRWMSARARAPRTRAALRPRSIPTQAFAAVIAFVLLGTATSAMTRDWTGARFLIPPEDAAQQAALMVDALGDCTLCIASPYGRMTAKRITAALETVDPIVANRRRPGDRRDYDEWLAMPGQIRAWYLEATGHEPSTSDLGHHLYQWREERVPATEIRRRIFAAAGKSR
jgi:hypothetical protein